MNLSFDRQRLQTVHMVPLTAYDSSGRLNPEVQGEHTSSLYAAGIRAFLPAAGTSEFHSLSADEIVELVKITRQASGPDAAVFAPVGLQINHALNIAERTLEAGATGLMFMPFVHPYLNDTGARDYYRTVIDRFPCPTLVYKKAPIPSDELLLELAEDPHVVGVKYAVNNMHAFQKIVQKDQNRIEWLCGSAERFAPYFMLAGSTGYTTGAGNVCPHLTLAMHSAFSAGEYQEGMRLQQTILPIEDYRALANDSYNITMLKHAMLTLGKDFGPPRPPQRQLAPAERAEIDALLKPILVAEEQIRTELASVGLSKS